MSLFRRIANLFSRSKVNGEIDDELRSHIEMRTADNVARGMSPSHARRDALVRFGNPTATRERVAGMDTALLLEGIRMDIRFACRQLARNTGFACTAILTLALGMCASVSIFSFVDAALIKPLPYADPSRLVSVFESTPSGLRFHLSYPDYLDWKRLNRVFTSLDAYDDNTYLLSTPSGVQEAEGATVGAGFFHTLGVVPILGRDFQAGEDEPSAARTVVLSYSAWQKRYGGRKDIAGQMATLSSRQYTIIGVLPAQFHFAPVGPAEFWTALQLGPTEDRGSHGLSAIARLADGVSIQAATANMQSIAAQLAKQYADADQGRGATVTSLSEVIVGNTRSIMLVLLCGATLLLLIACVNIANLLLVRAEARKREIAVRGALGASNLRLASQFIVESLILVLLGSTLGVGGAATVIRLLIQLIPSNMMHGMPYLQGMGLSVHTLLFAGTISLAIGILFATVPILRLSLRSKGNVLSDGGRGAAGTFWRRMGGNLVVIELAIAVVLLSGAGLLVKSFYYLLHTEIGIQPDHVATLHILLPRAVFAKDEQINALVQQLLARASGLPGATSAAIGHSLPVGNIGGNLIFEIIGRPTSGAPNEVNMREVSANYFTTLQAPLLRGRFFGEDEDASKPRVAIVNRSMAKIYFPHEDAIGKHLSYDTGVPPTEIVGIVEDIKEGPLDHTTRPAMYVPFSQAPENSFFLIVRSSQSEQLMVAAMGSMTQGIAPEVLTSEGESLTERIHQSPSAYLHRSSAWLVGGFAALALILGAMGLYGVLAYSVSQRTREIGIRMALGAQRSSVYQLVLTEAGWLTVIGIAAGLVCSVAAANLLRGLLFGVKTWDIAILASVAATLSVTALVASFIPVRRAASVNPTEALRAE